MQNLSERKTQFEIWESKAKIFAILLGGLWAIFTFTTLREKYQVELKIAEQESRHVALKVSMAQKIIPSENAGKIGVSIIVSAENDGIFPIDIDLSGEELLIVTKLGSEVGVNRISVEGEYPARAFNLITKNVLRSLSSITVFPGSSQDIHFYVEVDGPGVYFASFISIIPDEVLYLINQQEKGDLGESVAEASAWGAQLYFRVD